MFSFQDLNQIQRAIYRHILMVFDTVGSLGLEHGGLIARRKTGHGFQREEAIFGRLAGSNAKVIAQRLHELFRAAQGAGQICANLHPIPATLFFVVQRVKPN
jgi:hypothetical protein